MKKIISILMPVVLATTIFSCKSGKDNFVGEWVGCNHAEYSFTITKKEGVYTLLAKGSNDNLILEKKADEVLSIVPNILGNAGRRGTIRYDKLTNHLFITEIINKEERREEFCKGENSSGNTSTNSQHTEITEPSSVIPGTWSFKISEDNDFKQIVPYYNSLRTSEGGGTLEDYYLQQKANGIVVHKIVIKEIGNNPKSFQWSEYINDFNCANYSVNLKGNKASVYHMGIGDVELNFQTKDILIFLDRKYNKEVK